MLLTFYISTQQPHEGSSWLSHAINAAKIARNSPGLVVGQSTESLHKRLWWCIVLRDRNFCLGLRRQTLITSSELRTLIDLPNERDFESEIHGSCVYDSVTKKLLFVAFQEQCSLAVLLTELVSLIFAPCGLSIPSLSLEEFQVLLAKISKLKTS